MNKSGTSKASPGKKSARSKAPQSAATDNSSMSGLEKAAFWSVPATGAVAVICGLVALWLAFSPSPGTSPVADKTTVQPKSTAAALVSSNDSNNESAPPVQPKKKPRQKKPPRNKATTKNPPEDAPKNAPTPVTPADAPASPPIEFASVGIGDPVFHLFCQGGSLQFQGPGELAFDNKAPVADRKQLQGSAMECLAFNGVNQAVILPGITKAQGTLSLTLMAPGRRNCIFLDSANQNLTIRKNQSGLRWRIISKKWSIKIRETSPDFEIRKWHHIVMTWQQGDQAVIYVDGEEFDRTEYKNGNPDPANFADVLLGRTWASNRDHYEFTIGDVQFFDQRLDEAKIKSMNGAVRQQYPSFFN